MLTSAECLDLFDKLSAHTPQPTTELCYKNHFELLIAVMLSAQATDKSVNKATPALFNVANSAEQMLALGESELKNYIKTIGLYNTKAANIIKTSRILVEKYHGEIPSTRDELETLPGVGRKTANVILNVAFGQPTIAVDTHIFRLANRTGLTRATRYLRWKKINASRSRAYRLHAHHWLILHGRYVCIAHKPLCHTCVIRLLCRYPDKT
ncbi:MAG: endonuclease III [Thiotrichaceae bacterium]